MKPKILIVEDEKITIELLKLNLQNQGFEIISASDGEEGIKKARLENPILIILDINLPKLNGLEVCKNLKNDNTTKAIPIIMLTSHSDPDIKLEGFEIGADDYIVKPFEQRELLARIKSILRLINLQKNLEASREQFERLSVINEINKAISSSLNLEEIIKIIGKQIKRLINYDLLNIALIDKSDKFVKIRTIIPKEKVELEKEAIIPIEKIKLNMLKSKEDGAVIKEFQEISTFFPIPDFSNNILSAITVPLNARGRFIGTFNIGSYRADEFSFTEMEIIKQIAPQVAIALENARLIELQRQLIQAEKLSTIGELVSGVAHELNNPLTGIIGFCELILLDSPKTFESDLKRIYGEAKRAKKIVQNLLSFARMHKPEKNIIDLNSIINNVLELKSYEMKVDNIEIECYLDKALPPTMGDGHQLQQVFLNIINNAHQAITTYQKSGYLQIKTSIKETMLKVEFTDNGPGIPRENLNKIFEPFFTTKETGKGTGLGLSLSYGIIKDHGGDIQVYSELGSGTTFSIEIPLTLDKNAVKPAQPKSVEVKSIKNCEILVIDDEETVLELIKGILTREGNRVEIAKDGEKAIEKIDNKGYFDVIICDIKMSNMNGIELYDILKTRKSELIDNFIFMSGAIASSEYHDIEYLKKYPFLEKPFSVNELANAILKVLEKQNLLLSKYLT